MARIKWQVHCLLITPSKVQKIEAVFALITQHFKPWLSYQARQCIIVVTVTGEVLHPRLYTELVCKHCSAHRSTKGLALRALRAIIFWQLLPSGAIWRTCKLLMQNTRDLELSPLLLSCTIAARGVWSLLKLIIEGQGVGHWV